MATASKGREGQSGTGLGHGATRFWHQYGTRDLAASARLRKGPGSLEYVALGRFSMELGFVPDVWKGKTGMDVSCDEHFATGLSGSLGHWDNCVPSSTHSGQLSGQSRVRNEGE